jgi:amino acid transporter
MPKEAAVAIRATVPSGVFTRQSSGLVRQVGTLDTLFYNVLQVGIGYLAFAVAAWHFYPGASMELATVLAVLSGIALALVYALLSAVYPRSGGEYVFISRTIHPALGFLFSWSMAFWQSVYYGLNGAFLALFALAPFFGALGLQTGSDALTGIGTFFTTPWGIFLAGLVSILFFAFVMYRGMGLYFRLQRWGVWAILASLALTLVVLALGAAGALSFRGSFEGVAGAGAYEQVIASGQAAGAELSPAYSLPATLNYLLWPAFSLWFATMSVSFSGEIKNIRRGQLVGMIGAMLLAGVVFIALMFLARAAIGDRFLLASSALPADQFPLPIPAVVNVFATILANNPLLTILMSLWILLGLFFQVVVGAIYTTRAILAWGIDGMVPERLADVSERYHSPTFAIVVSVVIALACLAGYAFTPLLAILSGFLGLSVGFLAVALTGVVFPFVARETFENSPAAIRVAGIPLVTLAGLVGAISSAFVIYRLLVDDSFGANSTFSQVAALVVFASGLVWFYAARAIRARQGVNVDRRFAEIPIE